MWKYRAGLWALILVIVTRVLKNAKPVHAHWMNSIGNFHVSTLLLKSYLLPLTYIFLGMKCKYMSLVCNSLKKLNYGCVVFFQPYFICRAANSSNSMNDIDLFTRRPSHWTGLPPGWTKPMKRNYITEINNIYYVVDYCKIETCTSYTSQQYMG